MACAVHFNTQGAFLFCFSLFYFHFLSGMNRDVIQEKIMLHTGNAKSILKPGAMAQKKIHCPQILSLEKKDL